MPAAMLHGPDCWIFSTRACSSSSSLAARPPDAAGIELKIVAEEDLAADEAASRTVRLGSETLNLTPVEFDLLLCLARAAGRVLSRDRLLDAAAGRNYEIFDRSVDVHISSLRRKLGDNPRRPKYIKTVRAAGYMFCTDEEAAS